MQQYKSLMMVAVLSGVMVIMAGVLLSTETVVRKKKNGQPTNTAAWTPRGLARAEGRNGLFERSLGRIRLMVEAQTPATDRAFDRLVAQARALADETSFTAILAELQRPDLEPRMRDICLVMAGAAHAPGSIALLDEHFKASPRAVLRGVEALGGAEAMDLLIRRHGEESEPDIREAILRAMPTLAMERALAYFGSVLVTAAPAEAEVILEVLGTIRTEPALDILCRYLAGPAAHEVNLDRIAMGHLAAMGDQGGAARLLALHRDSSLPPERSLACGQALAVIHAPAMIPSMLDQIRGGRLPSPEEAGFLHRNLAPADLARLESETARGDGGEALRRFLAMRP